MSKALVILSGGQDSTTCLFYAKQRHDEVHAITFDYGQRHSVELKSAVSIAAMAGVKTHKVVRVGPILSGTSPLVNSNFQVDKYKDAQSLPGGLEKTFVPGRNALFLVLAANHAYDLRCNSVYTGVCGEDNGGYPDCRMDFIQSMQASINYGFRFDDNDPFNLEICVPLMYLDKAESVHLAVSLPGCLEALAFSHTCYQGCVPPCGVCHACLLRSRGFDEAGITDPLVGRLGVTQ